jgi:peptidoglycan/LPS O-acetylase OafA/YrhL
MTRNTSLDALRALAIVLVVFCHGTIAFGLPNRLDFLALGGIGVDLFFALSGWLLGRQLCQEFARTGTIEVRRFWLRRWLRTLPAYYAVLLATVGQSIIQHKTPMFAQYLVFLQNYIGHMPFFGISWSLCVEEYFYLAVAPLLLICLRDARWRWFAAGLLVVPAVSRALTPWVWAHFGWTWDLKMTHMRYDQCAAGVLLAAAATFAPRLWSLIRRSLFILVPIALGVAALNFYWRATRSTHADFGPLVWSAIFVTLVALANSSPFWQARFRIPGARFIADRAYALYLLHVEAIAAMIRLEGAVGHDRIPLALHLAGIWLLSLAAAEVLHRAVERPFMQSRERFRASRSTHGTPALAHR